MNPLSRQSSADRALASRSEKIGDYQKAGRRMRGWAVWFQESRYGVVIPDKAVLTPAGDDLKLFVFTSDVVTPAWTETVTGPRGGRRPPIHHPSFTTKTLICEPFEIPAWCQATRFADNWHACHQAGLPLDECESSGLNQNRRPWLDITESSEGAVLPAEPACELSLSGSYEHAPVVPTSDQAAAYECAPVPISGVPVPVAYVELPRQPFGASPCRLHESSVSFAGPSLSIPLFLRPKFTDTG